MVASLPGAPVVALGDEVERSQKPIVRPRRSGFDSARATISSLLFKAVPAAGATGATNNAARPWSARAATIFCIVPFLRGGGGG